MSEETPGSLVYRWHQLMFRLDEMDELAAAGVPEDEASAFETERALILDELGVLEKGLAPSLVAGLREAHEHDRAYSQQKRQIDEEIG